MPSLKPIDHQNIVLRLLARSAACDAQHLATLAHAHKLPVSLHQVRVACDELCEQQFVARTITGYRHDHAWGVRNSRRAAAGELLRRASRGCCMTRHAYQQPKCPECQYRKPPSEFRDPGTREPLPACKHCLRRKQRGGARWTA